MIQEFWETHPCGEQLAGGLRQDLEGFFRKYDEIRYSSEGHILRCFDEIDFSRKEILEIGLGQGADSEQIIRRGAVWSGLDLTPEAVRRTKARLDLKNLPYKALKNASVLQIPWPDNSFDIVFSHGVLHHVPEIMQAQKEIARVLKPEGRLVVMLYAKHSLNYHVSISLFRRAGLVVLYWVRPHSSGIYGQHITNAKKEGLSSYLRMKNFIHRNTDGPLNPYSKVYTQREVEKDFPLFRIRRIHKEFMHAPPLPVHHFPGSSLLGWHLWAHLEKK